MRFLLAASLLLSGCAYSVHNVYISDFAGYPKLEQGQMVKSTSEQHVIMGFVYETDYVDEARKKLIAQCPQGDISGISTQFSTSLGFFSWTNKVLMQGLCTKANTQASIK
ncbi:hypothetical protein [Bdellovibrio sp. HCB337]|uniref:hypothetical protein n=1 Tax=Bdellovibrio sp. HCB337 TaxID=3394358 RepID=UPI0039A57BAD